jgi:hypothetical protein
MKKIMLLGAMLAMVLMVAAPAVAQDDNSVTDNSVNDSFNSSQQFQSQNCAVVIDQYNSATSGDAIASGDGAAAGSFAGVNAPVDVIQQCIQAGDDAVGVVGDAPVHEVPVHEDDVVHHDDDVVHHEDDVVHHDDDVVHYDDNGDVVHYSHEYHYDADADSYYYYDNGGEVVYTDDSSASASAVYSVLPDTGGASLIALGAGALLVAGGLLARRIVR